MDGERLLWFGSRSLALGRILGSTIRHRGKALIPAGQSCTPYVSIMDVSNPKEAVLLTRNADLLVWREIFYTTIIDWNPIEFRGLDSNPMGMLSIR